ncbi:IucA/IucC family protein [Brevibacillus dissolubilis]|uniref:IucA/IucC family protein n=1 Tax=Brevibacillus dissolubilis TaxID=1844116 RepID=UPI0021003721|nr:IucA/IucC family protein [Brevibacillus dissolubilis]
MSHTPIQTENRQPKQQPHVMNQAHIVGEAIQSEQYTAVRRRIFRQLIEAIVYEGLLDVTEEAVQAGGLTLYRIPATDEHGNPVEYVCEGSRRLTFGRIRLTPKPIIRIAGDTSEEADSVAQFLLEIRNSLGSDDGRLTTFINEIEHTLLKDTLAQYQRAQEDRVINPAQYDECEGDIMDGHPYHPSYKSRIGFDIADHYAYGPEFKQELRPLWLAVDRSQSRFSISQELDYDAFLQEELGAEQHTAFTETIRQKGLDPATYLFVPVHPWQWNKIISSALLEEIREQRVVVLGESGDTYRPQQSIRTLANSSSPKKAYLKCSMSLINTSTGRILAPHTVSNAPHVSDWLHELVQSDTYLTEETRVIMLREIMGISYDRPARDELLQSKTYGILGCIWRESLHRYLEPGEQAYPFNGLTSLERGGEPVIAAWIRRYGAEAWLTRLFEAAILPIIHLLYAHGVALESHAQNMVLIHKDGWPVRVAFKDFHDGIRFSKAHLTAPEKCPDLLGTPEYHARVNRNSFIETDDLDAVRDFMHDAFFFINIGEIALLMADHFGFDELKFWNLVRQVMETYQNRFPELSERFSLFDLFAPTIEVEQLAKRRLFPDTELRVHRVPNPLHR